MRKRKLLFAACFFFTLTCTGQGPGDSLHVRKVQGHDQLLERQLYDILLQRKTDSLKFILRNRLLVSFNYGSFIMPSALTTDKDSITGVDLTESKIRFGIAGEYFITGKWSVGVELGFHSAKKVQDISFASTGVRIKGSGGSNISSFLYTKYFFGKTSSPVYNERLRNNNPYRNDIRDSLLYISSVNNARMRRPRFYITAGAGLTQTVLLRIKGNSTSVKVKTYEQQVPSAMVGMGLSSRIHKRFMLDAGARYIISQSYEPAIGGVRSYTGYNFQLSLGYIFKAGFNDIKK